MGEVIEKIQESLRKSKTDGWLFYSFRHSDPFAPRILKFKERGHATRRWLYFVPKSGSPIKIVHAIERDTLEDLEGETIEYLSWQELHAAIEKALEGSIIIAMQFSPMNDIPYVSCVDAGMVDLIRSKGKQVVTSAELIQEFESILSDEQMESHKSACTLLRRFVDEVFRETGERVRAGVETDECDVQKMITDRFAANGLVTSSLPVAAVNENSANPHYEPEKGRCLPVRAGDFLLIDLWAKLDAPHSVYGDITWTGFLGSEVPEEHARVFSVAAGARDAAVDLISRCFSEKKKLCGRQVDDEARRVITEAGYGKNFIHRTGHSIGEECHGTGVMIDNLETRDNRIITKGCCFSIEPGIYLPGRFGVRTEIDVFIGSGGPMVFGGPIQTEIVKIV